MTRPEVESVRRQLGVRKVREDDPLPLEAILASLRGYADKLFADNAGDPEFDVHPMFHAEGRDGAVVVATEGFGGPDDKAAAVAAWQHLLGEVAGRAWGMVMTAWGLEAELDDPEKGPVMDPDDPRYLPPSEHPERQEWAIVQGADLRRYEVWRASIVRDEAGVRLAGWERLIEGPIGDAAGDLVEPFVATVAMSALAAAFRTFLIDRPDEWWTWERLRAANRSLDRAGFVAEGRFPLGEGGSLEGKFAQAVEDFRTLGLIVEKDGELAPADELFELAGMARPS